MKHAPCKGCGRRKPYCHSSCNDYWEWRKKTVEPIREGERAASQVIGLFADRSANNVKHRQRIAGSGANFHAK